MMRFANQLSFI